MGPNHVVDFPLPNVTVHQISDTIQKNYVPQRGIKPRPLANWVSMTPLEM